MARYDHSLVLNILHNALKSFCISINDAVSIERIPELLDVYDKEVVFLN